MEQRELAKEHVEWARTVAYGEAKKRGLLSREMSDVVDDFVSAAFQGLCYAARRYDPIQGKFKNYAAHWIHCCIRRFIQEDRWFDGSFDLTSITSPLYEADGQKTMASQIADPRQLSSGGMDVTDALNDACGFLPPHLLAILVLHFGYRIRYPEMESHVGVNCTTLSYLYNVACKRMEAVHPGSRKRLKGKRWMKGARLKMKNCGDHEKWYSIFLADYIPNPY